MFVTNCVFILAACQLVFDPVSCPEHSQEVTVKPGEDVTLQCRGPRDASITVLEWNRTDLKTDDYVFFFRENRSYEHLQHPSFHGRVEMRHPEMEDGGASVILKNVNINDTGTYECVVSVRRNETVTELRHFMNLTVTDSGLTAGHSEEGGNKEGGNKEGGNKDGRHTDGGNKDGYYRPVVGLSVAVLLLVVGSVIVGSMIFIKRNRLPENNSYQPADTEADHQQV